MFDGEDEQTGKTLKKHEDNKLFKTSLFLVALADSNDLPVEDDQSDDQLNGQSSGQQPADTGAEQIHTRLVVSESSELKSAESTPATVTPSRAFSTTGTFAILKLIFHSFQPHQQQPLAPNQLKNKIARTRNVKSQLKVTTMRICAKIDTTCANFGRQLESKLIF